MYKWTLIISVPYVLFFWITSFSINLLYHRDFDGMMVLIWGVLILGFLISLVFFNIMLPAYQKEPISKGFFFREKTLKKKVIPTIFSKHIWFSILILHIINFILFFLISFVITILYSMINIFPYYFLPTITENLKMVIQLILVVLIPNLLYGFIWLYVIPKYVGLPYGKQPIKEYLDCTGLSWLKTIFFKKYIKTILFAVTSILIIYFITQSILGVSSLNLSNLLMIVSIFTFFTFCFWQEVLHRGIILTMLVNKYSQLWALLLQTFITIIFKIFIFIVPIFPYGSPVVIPPFFMPLVILDFICSSFISLILGYIYIKTGSLLPGLISIFILTFFVPISFFVPFFPISLFVIPLLY